ncbi:MAG: hypothetical protein WC661_07475 [Opitutaceae bacterium]|jgi:hypothetical protein
MNLSRLHWSLYFLVITAMIASLGAVFGAVAFPLFGWVTGADFPLDRLALKGAKTLGFYFTLWAPGIAIVLCVKRAYEQRRAGLVGK